MIKFGISSFVDDNDYEGVIDIEAYVFDDIILVVRWSVSEEFFSYLEFVVRKFFINFERKIMCREYFRFNVDVVYTFELDDYIVVFV